MSTVTPCAPPHAAVLLSLRAADAFTDCYRTDVAATVTQAEFVGAFYTTRLFKLERLLIAALAGRPSSDRQAAELATGTREDFAVWRVEQRLADQLLLADQTGRTRSWLMVEPLGTPRGQRSTRLYFGSAVVPRVDRRTGQKRFGPLFGALLGVHRAYSKALLGAAAARLMRSAGVDRGHEG